MASLPIALRHRAALAAVLHASVLASVVMVFCACRSNTGAYEAFNQADCLPAITLIDQNGRDVTLSSLKGKPVVVDFIYTRCPGPCLLLTQKMARIATRLSSRIGSGFTMVSITVDPEHDAPDQMAKYMKTQGIETKGWFFLTGPPARIDRVLTDFQLRRQRDPDGSVEHISGVFILGPDGREVREYDGEIVKATAVISDLQQVLESPQGKTS
jgi:protein SCO1/2